MSNLPTCSHFRSYKLQKQPVDGHTGRPGPRDPRDPTKTGKPGPRTLLEPKKNWKTRTRDTSRTLVGH